ncbi:MAG: ABC transporter permease [Deltaproteobacteria bacterium]|nr:ABC transporter permease [Deltaproteobacteria bacterium]MBW2123156.1 ABC transporter permease [Deltaproteobacteria bacterium]
MKQDRRSVELLEIGLGLYRRYRFLLIFLPALLIVGVFFFIPIFTLLRVSFYENVGMGVYRPAFTFGGYVKFLTDPFYVRVILFTLRIAVMVTLIALVAGYPAAYYVARASGAKKILCLLMIIIPLWTNLIVRIYGWFVILGRKGLINTLLVSLDVVHEPLSMVFTPFSVVIGLLDVVFPWVLLILVSVMEGIDWSIIEAARDLGASRVRSFYEVTFKLTIPGVAVAGLFAFVWAMGEYAVPSLLGSSAQRTISIEVADQILNVLNWPFGASIAFTLFTMTAIVLVVSNRISQKGARYLR